MANEEVAKQIWAAVKKAGGTDEVAAGLLGNAQQESGINPKAGANNDDWAFGIFQFEFGTSEYTKFLTYCSKKGLSRTSAKAQIEYLFIDGASVHNGSNIGYAEYLFNVSPRNGHVGHYTFNGGAQYGYSPKISWKEYLKLKDITKATEIWELIYEAASLPMMANRIKYAKEWYVKFKGTIPDSNSDEVSAGSSLLVHAEKLYSSDNFEYLSGGAQKEETAFGALMASMKEQFLNLISETLNNTLKEKTDNDEDTSFASLAVADIALNFKKINALNNEALAVSKTVKKGTIDTSTLPVITEAVEAPFFEVKINGINLGGYHSNKVPNYVKSLNIKKINDSLNEYAITLIHQISPGDDPNYIDRLISSIKYDTIEIVYGNANTSQVFNDDSALITDVTQSFDFSGCNIIYNISAISNSASSGATKHNFPKFYGKISDKIKKLLWEDKTSDLTKIFPGMADKARVIKEGLIPSNDKVVTVGAQKNITSLAYLKFLVERMENTTSNKKKNSVNDSIYMFSVNDSIHGSTFKIKEIKTIKSSLGSVPYMYEVNVGYPDDNYVLDFQVNSEFAWALAYEGSKKVIQYDYDIDAKGNLQRQNLPTLYQDEKDVLGNRNLWTSLTRYPVNALLTVRGLTQNSLLMQYIKINQYMYGAKRITSGVYVVTEQEDSIGNGVYTTRLTLMRVTGDDEYVNIDGRVLT